MCCGTGKPLALRCVDYASLHPWVGSYDSLFFLRVFTAFASSVWRKQKFAANQLFQRWCRTEAIWVAAKPTAALTRRPQKGPETGPLARKREKAKNYVVPMPTLDSIEGLFAWESSMETRAVC